MKKILSLLFFFFYILNVNACMEYKFWVDTTKTVIWSNSISMTGRKYCSKLYVSSNDDYCKYVKTNWNTYKIKDSFNWNYKCIMQCHPGFQLNSETWYCDWHWKIPSWHLVYSFRDYFPFVKDTSTFIITCNNLWKLYFNVTSKPGSHVWTIYYNKWCDLKSHEEFLKRWIWTRANWLAFSDLLWNDQSRYTYMKKYFGKKCESWQVKYISKFKSWWFDVKMTCL